MAPHEIRELKELIFNSVGDVSDLIEAVQSFASQKSSMSNVLEKLSQSVTTGQSEDQGGSMQKVALEHQSRNLDANAVFENVIALKQQMIDELREVVVAQQAPKSTVVATLLS